MEDFLQATDSDVRLITLLSRDRCCTCHAKLKAGVEVWYDFDAEQASCAKCRSN